MRFPEARDQATEDAYVHYWTELEDPEGLTEAIEEAVRRRRPQVALRLMGLLDDPSALEAGSIARQLIGRARLFLVSSEPIADDSWAEIAGMTGRIREEIMARSRARHRGTLRSDPGDMLGLCRGTHRRRR
jgi:hypothetical protein